jgi:hypothetical protein
MRQISVRHGSMSVTELQHSIQFNVAAGTGRFFALPPAADRALVNRAANVSPTAFDPSRDRRNASPEALALRRRNLALGSVRHGYCASADSGRETCSADYASTGRAPRHISWRTRLARTRSAGVGRGFFVRSRTGGNGSERDRGGFGLRN